MKDLHALLNDADPLRSEPALSADEAQRMRQIILDSGVVRRHGSRAWRGAVAVAALVVMAIGGTLAGRRFAPNPSQVTPNTSRPAAADAGERLQVQFATPGGTRIIWTINPEFQMNEVIK